MILQKSQIPNNCCFIKLILISDKGVSWPDIQHSKMNTSGDVDISPPDVVGGAGHSMPSEGSTSSPDVQVIEHRIIKKLLQKG